MSTPRKLDSALQSMLHTLASADSAYVNQSDVKAQKVAALMESRERLLRTNPCDFRPGDLVQWQPGLKYTRFPAYGEPMVVVEVLAQPVFEQGPSCGSTYFRSPCSLVLGMQRKDIFLCWHFDGRRLELVHKRG